MNEKLKTVMNIWEIIITLGIFLISNIILLSSGWNKIKMKIRESEIKITNMNEKIIKHEDNCNIKFDKVDSEIRNNQKEITNKLDQLIRDFGEYKLWTIDRIEKTNKY
jgi:hypothetical protein